MSQHQRLQHLNNNLPREIDYSIPISVIMFPHNNNNNVSNFNHQQQYLNQDRKTVPPQRRRKSFTEYPSGSTAPVIDRPSQAQRAHSLPDQNRYHSHSHSHSQTQTPMQAAPTITRPRSGVLYFSAFVQIDNEIGGCAWRVVDDHEVQLIVEGSEPVVQDHCSLMRMQLEALLNGLKAAFTKKLRRLVIKSDSTMIVNQLLRDSSSNIFQSADSHCIRDLTSAILKLLPQFHYIESHLISCEENTSVQERASEAIYEYYNKKFDKMVDRKISHDGSQNHSKAVSPLSHVMTSSPLSLAGRSGSGPMLSSQNSSPFPSPRCTMSADSFLPCLSLSQLSLSLSASQSPFLSVSSNEDLLTDHEYASGPSTCYSVASELVESERKTFVSPVSPPPGLPSLTTTPLTLSHPQNQQSELAKFEVLSPHTQVQLLLLSKPQTYRPTTKCLF